MLNLLLYIARISPALVFFITIILGLITNNQIYYVLFIVFNFSEIANYFLKKGAERIMGNKVYPFIGSGKRPTKKLKSFGMPSGHSQFTAALCTFLAIEHYYNNNLKVVYLLIATTLFVMFSRVYERFHTVQQTIAGAFIGTIIGYYSYKTYSLFK